MGESDGYYASSVINPIHMYIFSFLSPHCSYIDLDSGTARVEKYKSVEPAYVDQVYIQCWFWNGELELNNEGLFLGQTIGQ